MKRWLLALFLLYNSGAMSSIMESLKETIGPEKQYYGSLDDKLLNIVKSAKG